MNDARFDEFKKLVDEKFLAYQKNCATPEQNNAFMAGKEYADEIQTAYRDVQSGKDINAVAAACANCLYMLF